MATSCVDSGAKDDDLEQLDGDPMDGDPESVLLKYEVANSSL